MGLPEKGPKTRRKKNAQNVKGFANNWPVKHGGGTKNVKNVMFAFFGGVL